MDTTNLFNYPDNSISPDYDATDFCKDIVDVRQQLIEFTATGEMLNYDRLLNITANQTRVATINNCGLKGCFTLKRTEYGAANLSYSQEASCKSGICCSGQYG